MKKTIRGPKTGPVVLPQKDAKSGSPGKRPKRKPGGQKATHRKGITSGYGKK